MQIVTGRRGEPHVTSRQMQAVYRSFLGDFALLDIGEKLRAEAYSNDIVRVYDGVVSVQGIYAVIAYNQYDEVYIEPVSVGKKRIDTIVLHYTKNNTLDVEDMQLDVVQGEEYTDNPIAPVVPEGGDAWEGTTDIQVPIYDVEVTNFGLTVTPHARMLTVIPTLDSIAERIPDTVVTGVKGDSEVLYRDGDVNITKANIGLENVDNTADTDKPISTATQTALNLKADLAYVDAKISAAYHAGGNLTVAELTSALLITENMGKVYNMSDSGVTTSDFVEGAGKSICEGDNVGICNVGTEESPVYKFDLLSGFVDLSAYYTKTESDNKYVTKETGKGLSTEDYTTADKTKLAGISEGATQTVANPADTATETLSKLEVEGVVYDVPQGTTGATNLSELNDVNLSGTAEGDILEYDSTANKWKNSNALQGAKTATGNPLTIEDAAPVNAVNLSIDLEPIQAGSGTPSPDNIRPISGRSEVAIDGVGKNLFDKGTVTDGYRFGSDGIPFAQSGYSVSDYIRVDKSTAYVRDKNMNTNECACLYDSNKGFIDRITTGKTFQTTSATCYVRLSMLTTDKDTTQFEKGSTATTYEPYAGKTYTIKLGQEVYGAHHDVTRGKMVVDKALKILTSGGVKYGSTSVIYTNAVTDGLTDGWCISNVDKTEGSAPKIKISNGSVIWDGAFVRLGISTIEEFNTWNTSNPLQVCYELATPFELDLTPTQIKMLENTNTIYTDYEGDTITLEYQPNNAIGEAVRVVEESYDPEFAVRPPLKKIAFSGTTDSDGSVTLINASDIPSNHRIIPLQITDMTISGSAGTYFVEYKPYNSGDSVKGYCYTYFNGSQITPVGTVVTGNFYYYDLEV